MYCQCGYGIYPNMGLRIRHLSRSDSPGLCKAKILIAVVIKLAAYLHWQLFKLMRYIHSFFLYLFKHEETLTQR